MAKSYPKLREVTLPQSTNDDGIDHKQVSCVMEHNLFILKRLLIMLWNFDHLAHYHLRNLTPSPNMSGFVRDTVM
jgi:hypothetical protein